MKRFLRLSVVHLRSLRLGLVLLLATVCALAYLAVEGAPASARSVIPSGSQPEMQDPVSSAVPAESQQWRESSRAATYAAYLPMSLNGARSPVDAPFGVQILSPHFDESAVKETSQVGAGWVRLQFFWDQIEPVNTSPENYQWPEAYDALLADLSDRNIQTILTLASNPWWAASYPSGPIDKVEIGEMVQFMEAAVAHYGQPPYNVKFWEFYNEPDNVSELYALTGHGYFGTQPEAYVEILRAVYDPMKAIDPEAQIVFGGIAYDNWTPQGTFSQDFLDRVLEKGGGAYFDVMNFHYYPQWVDSWAPFGDGIIGKATFLRRKLAAYGLEKPFICTEAGDVSDPAHGGSNESQSRYVVQVLTRSMAADLGTVIWFHFVDRVLVAEPKHGLLNPDLSPKPSYIAYQTFSGKMSSADYERALAPGKEGSDQIEGYEFDLRFSPDHTVVAWTNDGASHVLMLETSRSTVTDTFGNVQTVLDGDDGAVDGRVHVSIGPSPVYVTFEP